MWNPMIDALETIYNRPMLAVCVEILKSRTPILDSNKYIHISINSHDHKKYGYVYGIQFVTVNALFSGVYQVKFVFLLDSLQSRINEEGIECDTIETFLEDSYERDYDKLSMMLQVDEL